MSSFLCETNASATAPAVNPEEPSLFEKSEAMINGIKTIVINTPDDVGYIPRPTDAPRKTEKQVLLSPDSSPYQSPVRTRRLLRANTEHVKGNVRAEVFNCDEVIVFPEEEEAEEKEEEPSTPPTIPVEDFLVAETNHITLDDLFDDSQTAVVNVEMMHSTDPNPDSKPDDSTLRTEGSKPDHVRILGSDLDLKAMRDKQLAKNPSNARPLIEIEEINQHKKLRQTQIDYYCGNNKRKWHEVETDPESDCENQEEEEEEAECQQPEPKRSKSILFTEQVEGKTVSEFSVEREKMSQRYYEQLQSDHEYISYNNKVRKCVRANDDCDHFVINYHTVNDISYKHDLLVPNEKTLALLKLLRTHECTFTMIENLLNETRCKMRAAVNLIDLEREKENQETHFNKK